MGFGDLFNRLKEDERLMGVVREAVEWLLLFLVLVVIFCH
jgi:hypothetical protein